VNRTVKFGLMVVVILGVVAAPLAYRHRRALHGLLHRMKHSLMGGGGGSVGSSAGPVASSLEIGGKKFTDVLGYPPYYLAVTQIDAVLFVTRLNNAGTNLFHLLNLKTGQEEQIPSTADFGRNIGSAGGGMRDYVERAAPGEVVVASETSAGRRVKSVYHLDLQAGIVDTRKVFYYDQNGQVTNVYEGPGF
jgi:hypothetical protein